MGFVVEPGTPSRERGDSEWAAMGSFTRLSYHIVFSAKYRKRVINQSFRERLFHYIGGIVRELSGSLTEIGGVEDHIHILAGLQPTIALSKFVATIKANSSRWINNEVDTHASFQWQKGYSAFTVSHSQIESVRRYIRTQEEHHRKFSFREEYIAMLQRHDIPFDENHLFEAEP